LNIAAVLGASFHPLSLSAIFVCDTLSTTQMMHYAAFANQSMQLSCTWLHVVRSVIGSNTVPVSFIIVTFIVSVIRCFLWHELSLFISCSSVVPNIFPYAPECCSPLIKTIDHSK